MSRCTEGHPLFRNVRVRNYSVICRNQLWYIDKHFFRSRFSSIGAYFSFKGLGFHDFLILYYRIFFLIASEMFSAHTPYASTKVPLTPFLEDMAYNMLLSSVLLMPSKVENVSFWLHLTPNLLERDETRLLRFQFRT